MSELDKKLQIDVLLKEYEVVTNEIHTRLSTNEKSMALGLTILGVGLTLAIKEKVNEILLFMPVGVFAVLFYTLQNNAAITSLGGYRSYLQEKLNDLMGERILIWERVSQRLIHRNIPVFPLYGIYALILGFSVFISLRSAWHNYGLNIFLATAVIFGILFILLAISIIKWFKTFARAYELAVRENYRLLTELLPNKTVQPRSRNEP